MDTINRGSIPACAGKPGTWGREHGRNRVYPRVCGEAAHRSAKMLDIHGLSPRVRGSLSGQIRPGVVFGSIPACAGKPADPSDPGRSSRVYPRVCGEAARRRSAQAICMGLSPRVRGSRHHRPLIRLLSSMEMKIAPSSRSNSRRSFRRGSIMQHHLSWRVRSSRSTTLSSQSRIMGELTRSL